MNQPNQVLAIFSCLSTSIGTCESSDVPRENAGRLGDIGVCSISLNSLTILQTVSCWAMIWYMKSISISLLSGKSLSRTNQLIYSSPSPPSKSSSGDMDTVSPAAWRDFVYSSTIFLFATATVPAPFMCTSNVTS